MSEVTMKYVAPFLAAVAGGLVGAGAMYLGTGLEVECPRASEVAGIHDALRELRDRMKRLETSGTPAPRIDGESETVPSTLKEALLEAARNAARDVATEIAQVESRETDDELVRETALSRALEQLQAPHEDTRRNGVSRLRRMFAAEASTQVLPALADESAAVRMEAAAYFEYLWDPAALDPLVELMHGENVSIAEQALDALCKSGEEEAIVALENYYLTGPELKLAFEAGKALEENKRTVAVPDGVQRFRDALNSTDPGERRLGVAGIGRWGTVPADEWRVRALAGDEEERVRTEVKKTLSAWGLESNK